MGAALNKPTGISSAQALRDLQTHFNPSELFAPWIAAQTAARDKENHNQRKRRKQKQVQVKIGHGGTLDPLATGVLIAGIGKGTKVLQDFLKCTKTYEAVILFGASTDTYDRVGKILKRAPYQQITRQMVEKALEQYRGTIMQLPPLYSALKMNGKPLYEYAREGKEIPREIEKREVTVELLELVDWYEGGTHNHKMPEEEAGKQEKEVAEKLWHVERLQDTKAGDGEDLNLAGMKRKIEEEQDELSDRPASRPKTRQIDQAEAVMSGGLDGQYSITTERGATEIKDNGPPAAKIRMTVTSGFYVRSLCHDLGEAVGSQAMMAELIRTRQGQFELGKNVLEYDELSKGEKVWGPVVERMLDEWSGDYRPFAGTTAEENGADDRAKTEIVSNGGETGDNQPLEWI